MAPSTLDPATMIAVIDLLLEPYLLRLCLGQAGPEDMATMNCYAAQRNYWATRINA